ncbi:MAG: hypothetical protein R3293_19575 [Candidatus Promineifilaceae bacterium]|nr:hypothetical protein [Candidatus Promineifilaceae bacterium]
MTMQTRRFWSTNDMSSTIIFMVGLLLLIGSWLLLYGWVALFTEAYLVPWYCCDFGTIPDPGSWPRAINDFFATAPGSHLPSFLLIGTSVTLFIITLSRKRSKTWIPMIFFIATILLLGADWIVTDLSWALSNWIVGPRVGGIDAGFHRTWYGILSHLLLWITFFVLLAKVTFSKDQ